jgi:hypothetical protein
MRACAFFGVSLVVRLGAMSVAFEGGIVSAGGLQTRHTLIRVIYDFF